MVYALGVDIIEVERVKKIVEKNQRFIKRVFTPEEIKYCLPKKNKYQHLAARFAAKEAFFKALGKRISWTEIGLINLPSGKPQLQINSKEKFLFRKTQVSISHLQDFALAVVILEK